MSLLDIRLSGRGGRAATDRKSNSVLGLEIPIAAAWSAIAVGDALHDGTYSTEALLLMAAAVCALGLAVVGRMKPSGEQQLRWALSFGFGVAAFGSVFFPAGIYASGGFLAMSRGLTTAAAATAALWIWLRLGHERAVAAGVVSAMALAGAGMILASPKPAIDDWYMLQAATNGLSHGHNIYTVHWQGPPFEASSIFVYLPGTAVFLWPFHVLFGDVRFGILFALAGTAFLLIRLARPGVAAFCGSLVFLFPRALFGLEQSWMDPLVVFGICLTVFLVLSGKQRWAVLTFAACLTLKQTAWVLLPLAALWRGFGWRRATAAALGALLFVAPWAIAAPHAFYEGAVSYNLFLPTRPDSLSLYSFLALHRLPIGVAVTALGLAAVLALVLWRHLLRGTAGFVLGAALVMGAFNLFSKLTFFNEWSLSAALALMALVVSSSRSREIVQEPRRHATDPDSTRDRSRNVEVLAGNGYVTPW